MKKFLFLSLLFFVQVNFALKNDGDSSASFKRSSSFIFKCTICTLAILGGVMFSHDLEQHNVTRLGVDCNRQFNMSSCFRNSGHCNFLKCVRDGYCDGLNDRCYPHFTQGKPQNSLRSCNMTEEQRKKIQGCSQFPGKQEFYS